MNKYKCPQCNKSFTNRSSRSLCLRRHNDENLFFHCPICPRIYRDPGSLRKHKRLHHRNPAIKNENPEQTVTDFYENVKLSEVVTTADISACSDIITRTVISNCDDSVSNNPMNLSTHREELVAQTLPSIDTFKFSNVNASSIGMNNDHAIDLTSHFKHKSTADLIRGHSRTSITFGNSIQHPINLTIQTQATDYLAQLPIDLSFNSDHDPIWDIHGNSITFNEITFSASPLDLTLDQSYSDDFGSVQEMNWIC